MWLCSKIMLVRIGRTGLLDFSASGLDLLLLQPLHVCLFTFIQPQSCSSLSSTRLSDLQISSVSEITPLYALHFSAVGSLTPPQFYEPSLGKLRFPTFCIRINDLPQYLSLSNQSTLSYEHHTMAMSP